MRDHNDITQSLLRCKNAYEAEQTRKKRIRLKITASALTLCFIAFVGWGAWTGGLERPAALPNTPTNKTSTDSSVPETAPAVWQTASEILRTSPAESDLVLSGVFIPTYVACRGSFYGAVDEIEDRDTQSLLALSDTSVLFTEDYPVSVYLLKDRPDCIALLINGYFTVYQKLFAVTFEFEGITYGIEYNYVPAYQDSHIWGDILVSGDGFTVRPVTAYPGEDREFTKYVVDILPKLRAEGLPFFQEDGEYADAVWVAKPLS